MRRLIPMALATTGLAGLFTLGSMALLAPSVVAASGNQIYNSRIAPSSYVGSYAYDSTQSQELGNKITLASTAEPLTTVEVDMANFTACGSPGETGSLPITLNIYHPPTSGNGVGSLIGTDTQTFTIPCTVTGYTGTPNPTSGIDNFTITFDLTSQHLTLPSTIVYGIAYDNTSVETGLNVQLATESTDVSVGKDTNPGTIYLEQNPAGSVELTCSAVTAGAFLQYPTASGAGNCGEGPTANIPAVEFDQAAAAVVTPTPTPAATPTPTPAATPIPTPTTGAGSGLPIGAIVLLVGLGVVMFAAGRRDILKR